MKSIKINTGIIKLEIDRDGEKSIISFNPNDVLFAEKAYGLLSDFTEKQKEYELKIAEIEKSEVSENSNGSMQKISLLKEICLYLQDRIDYVFGDGTSKKVFGQALTLDMFQQFFEGIIPYIQNARENKLNKYSKSNNTGVMS